MNKNDDILEYLQNGGVLTGLDALRLFGTMKLATRISEIRKKYPEIAISQEMVSANGKHFARYWISKVPVQLDLIA